MPWPVLSYYPGSFLERIKKLRKTSIRILVSGLRTEPETSQLGKRTADQLALTFYLWVVSNHSEEHLASIFTVQMEWKPCFHLQGRKRFKDGGSTFLRIVGDHQQGCMSSQPKDHILYVVRIYGTRYPFRTQVVPEISDTLSDNVPWVNLSRNN